MGQRDARADQTEQRDCTQRHRGNFSSSRGGSACVSDTSNATTFIPAELRVELVLVDRHPATTVQYKFAGISPRSMEIYRSAGLEDAIKHHATGYQKTGEIARAHNLTDP